VTGNPVPPARPWWAEHHPALIHPSSGLGLAEATSLRVGIDTSPGRVVLTVGGELDLASAPVLRAAVAKLPDADEMIEMIVDLEQLAFMDSAGLHVLFGLHRRAAADGFTLALRGVRGQVAQALAVSGLADVFEIRDSGLDRFER